MVIEYTQQEKEALIKIDKHYAALLDQKDAELKKHGKRTKIYARLLEERDTLEAARFDDMAAVYEQAEQDRFNALNGDIKAIAAEARRQVGLIIEQRINADLVRDEKGSEIMQRWQNGIISEQEAEKLLQNTGFITRYQKEQKPLLTSREARTLIYKGIKLFTEFLKDNQKETSALNKYISEYISTSPYIYIYTGKPQEQPETVTDDIRLPLAPIETYGLLNDKVNNQLISGDIFTQETNGQLQIAFRTNQAAKGKPQVIVSTGLTFTGTQTRFTKRMSAFDNAVYNAISTAFYYHKRESSGRKFYITPQEIWRLMNGTQDASKNPSAAQVKKVCDSMDKMRFARLYMDISEEVQTFKIHFEDDRIEKGVIDTYLLKSDKVSFTTEKGKEIIGYRVDAEPILYTYNAAKDHVLFVPFDLLDTSQTTGNEGSTIEIRNYLLQQIQLMYNGQRNSRRILYETLYSATGLETPENRLKPETYKDENAYKRNVRKEAQKDRDKVAAILKAWKAKGYIKDFAPVQKGRAFIGVDVELNRKAITINKHN